MTWRALDVGDQPGFLVRFSNAERDRARHRLQILERPRYLRELDPEAAHLELVVTAAEANDVAVGQRVAIVPEIVGVAGKSARLACRELDISPVSR